MKIRLLKKFKFFACFDWFYTKVDEHYQLVARYEDGKFTAYAESDYDNGLYTVTENYPVQITWKDFITNIVKCTLRNQKHHRKPYYIYIYNGKCKECGRPVKFDDFEAYCGWKCDSCWKKFWDDIEDEL